MCWVLCCGVILGALSSLATVLLRKKKLVSLLELYCGYLCSVFLHRGAVGWSAVCDCGISWSYSLAPPVTYAISHAWIQKGDRGVRTPHLKNHKNIGLLNK